MKKTTGKEAAKYLTLLFILICIWPSQGCGPEDDQPDDPTGCDSTSYCGYPCMTSSTSEDYYMLQYGRTTSSVQKATVTNANGTFVSMSFKSSGFTYNIQRNMRFSTNYYIYATNFTNDDVEPYDSGNGPAEIHVICVTSLTKVTPGSPYRSAEKQSGSSPNQKEQYWFQEYNTTFEMQPVIISGGKMNSSYIQDPSPSAITKTGSSTITTKWNTDGSYGPLEILFSDGNTWQEPDPLSDPYNPAYEERHVTKMYDFVEATQIHTDSSSGMYFYNSGSNNQNSEIYCDDTVETMFQVMNYFQFGTDAITNDTLMVIFNIAAGLGSKEQEYERDHFCDEYGQCGWTDWESEGSAKTDSTLNRYHTDTLFLTTWTNGDYNDQSSSEDIRIDSIEVHSGYWSEE